jgi:D-alanine-D-alanine ligase
VTSDFHRESAVSGESLRVLVLAGGPDRERPVSLLGGCQVADALREAGHDVLQRDVMPDDLTALDEFARWDGDVVFPVLHGRWGEGGGLQRELSDRDLCYVGSGPAAAGLCMNKHLAKLTVAEQGVHTPQAQLLLPGQDRTIDAPVVIKALEEGSTFGLAICKTEEEADRARGTLAKDYPRLLVERYVPGKELTVGVIADEAGYEPVALPVIQVVPAGECYDYDAKYERDDTQYLFDIDLPDETLQRVRDWSVTAYRVLGVRHLCRADFMVDAFGQPWFIEVNTMPGFTTHSLLPMAAARAGLNLNRLADRLVRLALPRADPGGTAPG